MPSARADWTVLLIGGPSGVGKTILAERLGRRYGASWLQVDDLRLALEHGGVAVPDASDPASLAGLVAVGEALAPALEIVIANHVNIAAPLIIEGDAILPALLGRPRVRPLAAAGQVRAVFLREPAEGAVLENMRDRAGRRFEGPGGIGLAAGRRLAERHWRYGRWLAGAARRYGLPVLEPRPWDTLAERIMAATG